MPMRGLTVIVATADEARFRSAAGLALSYQALGGRVTLFLDTDAAPLIAPPITGTQDARFVAGGMPPLSDLIEEVLAVGIKVTLCQAGMAMVGLAADALDPRLSYGGMIGLLADLDDARLVTI
jgi:predicted peroxiredoxin